MSYNGHVFRIITGVAIIVIGLGFLLDGIFVQSALAVFGIIISAIGVAILLNKKEDEIEEIKNDKNINHE